MPKLRDLFNHKKKLDPGSETYLLDKVIERVRKEKGGKTAPYNKHPELLIDEVQDIADTYPDVTKDYGESYFMAFAAGVLVERYGISVEAAVKAISAWSSKK